MTKTMMPTPDLPHRYLASVLPTLREMLEEQREFRLEQLDNLTSQSHLWCPESGDLDAVRDDPRCEVMATLAAGARQALADIETALVRMDTGEYGRCMHCSEQISVERLSVIPETSMCVGCRRQQNRR